MVLYTGHDYESFRRRVSFLIEKGTSVIGDVKCGFQTQDHNGWVVLDGRSVTSLNSIQQGNAFALGFNDNLPDSTDSVLGNVSGLNLGGVLGSNSVTIGRSNLPNFTLSGSTSIGGAHGHQVRFRDEAGGGGTGRVGAGSVHDSQVPTLPSGDHNHSITTESLNGNVTQQSMSIRQRTMGVNLFVYLGAL